MPAAHFYVRNHFPTPTVDPELYELTITGLVERPLSRRRDRKDKSYRLDELERPTVGALTTPTRRIPAPGPQQVRSTRCVIRNGENYDPEIG